MIPRRYGRERTVAVNGINMWTLVETDMGVTGVAVLLFKIFDRHDGLLNNRVYCLLFNFFASLTYSFKLIISNDYSNK